MSLIWDESPALMLSSRTLVYHKFRVEKLSWMILIWFRFVSSSGWKWNDLRSSRLTWTHLLTRNERWTRLMFVLTWSTRGHMTSGGCGRALKVCGGHLCFGQQVKRSNLLAASVRGHMIVWGLWLVGVFCSSTNEQLLLWLMGRSAACGWSLKEPGSLCYHGNNKVFSDWWQLIV